MISADRARDDVTDYSAERRALAWEVTEIRRETLAYNKAQALRLAKLGALDHRPRSERRSLTETEIAAHTAACMDEALTDNFGEDATDALREFAP